MKRLVFAVPILALLAGCANPYRACGKFRLSADEAIAQLAPLADNLHTQGLITGAEEGQALGYLKFANDSLATFGACVAAAHTNPLAGTFSKCAVTINVQLSNPSELALLHVANQSAQQQLIDIANGVTAGAVTLTAALGGA